MRGLGAATGPGPSPALGRVRFGYDRVHMVHHFNFCAGYKPYFIYMCVLYYVLKRRGVCMV
jgi:hypothetical protein